MTSQGARKLKILHVLRAPLGGLFRHVLDLSREQVRLGHSVGLIADSSTGGAWAAGVLSALAPDLAFGVSRTPMRRNPHLRDAPALRHVLARIREVGPDIVHGHGSKGGAFARLAAFASRGRAFKVGYTPHGGSFNFMPGSLRHRSYMAAESFFARATDVFLFESDYIRSRFHAYASPGAALERVVLNGIGAAEFRPVAADPGAADFLYVGELRAAKGIDTLLEALAVVRSRRGATSAVLVGSGPDQDALIANAARLGLSDAVTFVGQRPAREAFALGRVMVVPSRAESLPYVVLEAAGAHMPLIATNVGGIPEIFGPFKQRLIPSDDVDSLVAAMIEALAKPDAVRLGETGELADYVASKFTIENMVGAVMAGYRDALDRPPSRASLRYGRLAASSRGRG